MNIRVPIEAFAEVDARAELPGKSNQLRELIAIRLHTAPGTVDHGRTDDHGTNPFTDASLANKAVHFYTRPPERDRFEVGVLREDGGACILATGGVRNNARSCCVNQRLCAALKCSNQGEDRTWMVRACGVNDRIGRMCGVCEYTPIIQGADNRVNSPLLQQESFVAGPD